MERRLGEVLPARREVLAWGGLALAGMWVDRIVWPLRVRAAGKANPRATARNCILIEMGGGISQVDCWDFKETRRQPKDLDVRKVSSEVYLPKTLFPKLIDQMHEVALVRSLRAPELVHFNGQYHTQAGRALNAAIAREIPAFGSVIAYELESQRRESDTFPTYVSTTLTKGFCGPIGSGFLPSRFTGLDLDATTVLDMFSGRDSAGVDRLLEERWRLAEGLARLSAAERASLGEKASDHEAFYRNGYRILNDPRWAGLLRVTREEKRRYGSDEYGLGLILARNLIAADAGTRFVYVYDGNRWDQHTGIFDRQAPYHHYGNCYRFDKGFVSLLEDLQSTPGSQPGKTLLDETLIVAASEFGRTPQINQLRGRHHWRFVYTSLFAGGGVKGGRVIGRTDDVAGYCVDTGWKHAEQPQMDNVVATIYSALGIDWMKVIDNTPSGRSYHYIETAPVGGAEFISGDAIDELFE